ncbi:hypothetical protein N7513_003559 [Penicillium frequentans]|nr:hypothetical protein N7513_004719 [Penicillium glabrum]KAJ5555917.1 hypothetical protein N7513_003559 [Penicillium glabrum]
MRNRQSRRSRSHSGAQRVKRSRSDNCPARPAPAQASYAGNASVAQSDSVESSVCAANSSSTGPSMTPGPSAGTGPSTGAKHFDNTKTLFDGETLASVGIPDITPSSGNTDVPGINDEHHADTNASNNTAGPRMGPLPTLKEYSHLCWICRQPFQISTGIKDNWKCFHQPPFLGNNGDLLPAQLCGSAHNPSMHVCCWDIAQKLLPESILSGSHVMRLLNHLRFLSPFARPTPSCIETNSIDLELFTDNDSMSVMQDKDCRQQLIPEAVLSQVSKLLDQKQDSLTVDELRGIDACLAHWMTLSHPNSLKKVMRLDFQRLTISGWHGTISKKRFGP